MKSTGILILLSVYLTTGCQSPVDPAVTQRLQQEAAAFNQKSNLVTASGIRMDSASASGAGLRFYFTLVNNSKADFNATAFTEQARKDVLASLDAGGNTTFFRDNNVKISYTYYDRDGAVISTVEIQPGDYNQAAAR